VFYRGAYKQKNVEKLDLSRFMSHSNKFKTVLETKT